ncbi:endonuclease/exonuclease/phosphatase family protein [Salinisphaera sp. P385]|uniref:Endonuclease/exonuclease/phosphatase family protein n=1 Tax=Spectribacter acetivorans TaxID=3075603 RepID=A0ABU3B8X8_9GAMM|nr:endonuclease/exonuclease/phosphatase family protein [Salinisphaera sp. P385]MDT0618525.1 endonuclease/exonuclease/phosphatase family protein [Salinisphaera sp. P385]
MPRFKTALMFMAASLFSLAALPTHALTIASWNAKHLGWGEKRNWSQSAQVIADYDFVAVQEVHGEDGVKRLISELEQTTSTPWSYVMSRKSVGRGRYTEDYVFLWQEQRVNFDGGAVLYLDPGDVFAREPFAARFSSEDGALKWTAATVHIIYGDSKAERIEENSELDEYANWLIESVSEGTPVLIMGDFNLPPDSRGFNGLKKTFRPAITRGATTLSSIDGRFANLYDNIWLSPSQLKRAGWPNLAAGIDRFPQRLGLTHENARKHVSDHAPVYLRVPR